MIIINRLKAVATTLLAMLVFTTTAQAAKLHGPYMAEVIRVKDGDNVAMALDVAPGMVWNVSLRLKGVDAPEKRRYGKGRAVPPCEKVLAAKAQAFTEQWLAQGPVTVTQVSQGKYAGRVLGHVMRGGKSLSDALIKSGHGRPYHGGKRGGWCK